MKEQQFTISDPRIFKMKMLNWVMQFNIFCFLDNNGFNNQPEFDFLIAIAGENTIELKAETAFSTLKEFHKKNKGWLFGHLGYDLKNEDPSLFSQHPDNTGFPEGFFFSPEVMVKVKEGHVFIFAENAERILDEIQLSPLPQLNIQRQQIRNRISKADYVSSIRLLLDHIQRGDCYEINFCQEFFAENAEVEPLSLFISLNNTSPNPFASFYRLNEKFCICASPERFLKKSGKQIISQPIKGTSKRFTDPFRDKESFDWLTKSEKDKSENVMIVDLVRNDLSKVCKAGSVKATELFKVVPFPNVYQMISTISGELKDVHWTEALRATFPMGSMTGAPKYRVMQLIEQYEKTRRGLYSGSIGYVTPNEDLDFNVVIRSIFYNSESKYLSFMAGGGITSNSEAEKEYEECLMKTKAITDILGL